MCSIILNSFPAARTMALLSTRTITAFSCSRRLQVQTSTIPVWRSVVTRAYSKFSRDLVGELCRNLYELTTPSDSRK